MKNAGKGKRHYPFILSSIKKENIIDPPIDFRFSANMFKPVAASASTA
jgi:hypothetical protein